MGKRGLPPTPTAILEARGSWRAKTRKNEPEADGVPVCPEWLQGEAKKHWDITLERLLNMGVVGEIDADKLAMYCAFYVLFLQELSKKNRDANALTKYATMVDKLGTQFGMSPSARAGMATNPPKQKDTDIHDIKKYFRTA